MSFFHELLNALSDLSAEGGWIFWMLIRIPVVNTIFSVTTLTHYFKRFHEPETHIKDLMKMKGLNNKANSADTKNHAAD